MSLFSKENRSMALRPKTFEELMSFAEKLSQSDLVPEGYKGKPGNIIAAVQMGSELGLPPLQSLHSIAVINGRPSLYGDVGLAIVEASGKKQFVKEDWDDASKTARCQAKRKGDPIVADWTFSMADADRISVWEKGGMIKLSSRAMYKNYPRRMCQMRARWFALRDKFPDVLKGLIGAEEAEEISPDAPVVTTAIQMPKRLAAKVETAELEKIPLESEQKPSDYMEAIFIVADAKRFADERPCEILATSGDVYFTLDEDMAKTAHGLKLKWVKVGYIVRDEKPWLTDLKAYDLPAPTPQEIKLTEGNLTTVTQKELI